MPAAVMSYKNNNNLQDVMESQREIIRLYRKDISQYDEKTRAEMYAKCCGTGTFGAWF